MILIVWMATLFAHVPAVQPGVTRQRAATVGRELGKVLHARDRHDRLWMALADELEL
jgi:hypothetical protein